ncbi:MAG: glycosyltransferase family 2 protein [Bifidobacteriaceae bacterium]|nr:glycosyltransferase family 2 protein [Bifidobacteriaceae bacterium]
MNEKNPKSPVTLRSVLAESVAAVARTPRQVNAGVAAVITVESDLAYLPRTLDAVLSQTVLPAVLIIADSSSNAAEKGSAAYTERLSVPVRGAARNNDRRPVELPIEICVVPTPHATSFGDAVGAAISGGTLRSTTSLLWLLHDDSRPVSEHSLEMLLEADRNSPGAKLIGAKQVEWDDTSALQNVGYYITGNHQRANLSVDGEEDQDQYNDRQDVFGVSLAGSLVSLSTWMNLSGTDAWYGTFGEGLDFARRVYLSGGRVVVAPRVVVAHRRARLSGVRTREGRPIEADGPRSAYSEAVTARDKFASSEVPVWEKPFLWIWHVLTGLGRFVMNLFAKKPYEAVCELVAPWRSLVRTPQSLAAHMRLRSFPRGDRARFSSLVTSRAQLTEWRARRKVFAAQRNRVVFGPLAVEHFRSLRRRRTAWILLLVLLGVGMSMAMSWQQLGGIFSGLSLYSSILAPSAAGYATLVKTATTMWSFSSGLGTAAAPLPFGLVLVVLSVLTGGHVSLAISLFFLCAPALGMVSFWALAGVVTRSNPLRFASSLLWGVLPGVLGLYQTANLPMLVVFVFLPLSFFFVFRAVGMYAVDAPRRAYSSIQAAALAGLSMTFVALSEPQLVVPFFLIFAVFLVIVRTHRAMLLLMPLPSIIALMPTFFSVLLHVREGLWRQVFADATTPDVTLSGSPSAQSFLSRFGSLFSSAFGVSSGASKVLAAIVACGILIAVACAVIALFIPSGLRMSRMAWTVAAAGAVLGFIAPRVAIGLDSDVSVAASILPAASFLSLGVLMAACAVTGRNDGAFSVSVKEIADHRSHAGMRFAKVSRPLLAVVMTLSAAAGVGMVGATWTSHSTVGVMSSEGLPIIASEDLAENDGARVLGLYADTSNHIDYSVMRTPAGDLIDANATTQVADMLATGDASKGTEAQLRAIAAKLLASNDNASIASLAKLGFSGIYIPASTSTPRSNLAAHVTASDGTEQVVDNSSGLYVRLTGVEQGTQHIATAGEMASYSDPLRKVWLVLLGVVTLAYLIVAIPRSRTFVQEEDR